MTLFYQRAQAVLLFEFMLVLLVFLILFPVIFSVFKQSMHGIKDSQLIQQRLAEDMEIFFV